ncbi:MAG: AraC family transcriptional regulator [Cyclobacteriaceae bacterium]|jgi:AraC-like DNA-binding protein|nr:AraC family transcriptional regulator [Cyclobacteriaceae bacterium]
MKAIFEKVPGSGESSIGIFAFDQPEFDGHWHFHPECELTYILKSTGIRYVGNHVADFEPGDLVLLGSNLPHSWKNLVGFKGTARSIVIQWNPSIIGDLPELEPIYKMIERASRGLRFSKQTGKMIAILMLKLLDEPPVQRYISFIRLLSKLTMENKVTMLAGASYAYDLSYETENRLNKVQVYVKNHFRKKLKLSDISSHINMTEQTFSRFFSKAMQRPFFVFLNEYRVNIASRMLLETDLQVAEIGFQCGYETLPFFYKQFKKFKGHSPLGFRKLYSDGLRK